MKEELTPHKADIRPCWMVEMPRNRARNLGLVSRKHSTRIVVKALGMGVSGLLWCRTTCIRSTRSTPKEKLTLPVFPLLFPAVCLSLPPDSLIYISHPWDSLRHLGIKVSISAIFPSDTLFHRLLSFGGHYDRFFRIILQIIKVLLIFKTFSFHFSSPSLFLFMLLKFTDDICVI